MEGGVLIGGQVDLHDLFDAAGADLDGHPDAKAVDTELAFQIGAGGEDTMLVQLYRFHHLGDGGRGGVIGAALF